MKFSVFVEPKNLSHRLDSNYYSPEDIKKEELLKRSNFDYLNNRIKKIAGGATPKGANYLNKGIAFIRTQNIYNNLIDDKDLVYISPESNEELKRSQLKENDVLLTITGVDLGRSAVVSKAILPANINQHSVKIEVKNIDPHFLSVFLNSSYGQSQIWRRVYGATRPAINYEEIKEIVISVPSENIQNYIGNKVRKAEELREEAKLLSEKAKKLVINKLGDIPQKITEKEKWGYIKTDTLSSSRLDANYYSGVYLEIEKLLKNRTKSFSTLSSLCKRISQGYNKNNYGTCNNAFAIGIGDFGDLSPIKNEEKKVGFPTEKTLQKFDIIWCSTAHLQKYIGEKINIVMEPDVFVPTPEITFIRPDISKINPYYLFIFMQTEWGYYQIQRTVKGLVPRSYPEDIKEIIIPLIEFTDEELSVLQDGVEKVYKNYLLSKTLIKEAKQDVEDLIEGKFDESKISEGV